MSRDDLIQLFVLAVTASVTGAAFAALLNSGFKSEDVFAFSGAVVGAAGTVAGAAWLTDRSSTRERREEQTLVRAELLTLSDISHSASEAFPANGLWTDNWRSAVHAMSDVAEGTGRFLDEVINYAKTLNFHQREEIKIVRTRINYFARFYGDVFGSPDDLDPMDERDWSSMIEGVLSSTRSALTTFENV
jgi:hypothetical protein